MLSKIPRGRFLEVDEAASMIAWLCTRENSFTTGATFDLYPADVRQPDELTLELRDLVGVRRDLAGEDAFLLLGRVEGDLDVVLDRMTRDKKAINHRLTWILPVAPGVVTIRQDVPIDDVVQIAREVVPAERDDLG
jgi:hypothetical protein